MKQCGYGYYLDIKQDLNNKIGVIDYCRFVCGLENRVADFIFTIDKAGNILYPFYFDKAEGFIPLSDKIDITNEGMDRFLKSHKATFGVLGNFVAVVDAKIRYNKDSHELVKSDITFYVPKTIVKSLDGHTDDNDNPVPVMILQKCADKDSYLTKAVNPNVLNEYRNRIMNFLTYDTILNKEVYMKKRVGL